MDLVREILLSTERLAARESLTGVDGRTKGEFAYNVDLMKQAGLVEAAVAKAWGSEPVEARVNAMTWEGHDLLDAIRDDTIWHKTKTKVLETAGTVSMECLKAVAVSLARGALGLPG
jgi:hypothetical protein